MTPLDRFDVLTPLGPAICFGIIEDGPAVEWVTAIKATSEIWFWRNEYVRLRGDIISGLIAASPISMPPGLEKHVKRYKTNGWL